jgi:Uma2 family endonuclease
MGQPAKPIQSVYEQFLVVPDHLVAEPDTAYFELAPDWVCEVLSPATQAIDRAQKMPIYAEHKVSHAWLVDPLAKLLELYRLDSGRWLQLGTWSGDASVRAEPFDAIEIGLASLWSP